MNNRSRNLVLGLAAFTLLTLGLGKFFDTRCTGSCIGEAFAANVEGGAKSLKELEKYHIFLDDKNARITIHDSEDEEKSFTININDKNDVNINDANRIEGPLVESYPSKGLERIVIKSFVTDWVITESKDDKVGFIFKDYLPAKEWTVKESAGKLEIEFSRKGPGEAELQLPKGYKGNLEFGNVSGEVNVNKLAVARRVIINNVSGDLSIKAAPSESFNINTVSGDVEFEAEGLNRNLEIDVNAVSADTRVNLKNPVRSFASKTVSGDVNFSAGKDVAFDFEMEGVSASFNGLPKGTVMENSIAHHEARGSFGKGTRGKLSFNSVSGDFQLVVVD